MQINEFARNVSQIRIWFLQTIINSMQILGFSAARSANEACCKRRKWMHATALI